jgi:hypothetical protein
MNLRLVAALAVLTSRAALAQPAPTTGAAAASVPPVDLRLAPPALAQPAPVAPPTTETRWYGWKILLADGAALGAAYAVHQPALALGWLGTGAMVHAAYGHYGRSVASLVLRAALPVLGATLAASGTRDCGGDLCGFGEAIGGGLAGAAVAEGIDLVLGIDEREVAPPRPSHSWAPVTSVGHAGATVGVAARF